MHAHRFWAAHKTTQWREEKTNTPINMHARTSDHQPATCDRSASWRWDKRRERSDGLWPRRPPPPLIDPNRELESMSEHPPTRGGETPPQNPTRKRARGTAAPPPPPETIPTSPAGPPEPGERRAPAAGRPLLQDYDYDPNEGSQRPRSTIGSARREKKNPPRILPVPSPTGFIPRRTHAATCRTRRVL
jgi:hypothetical protein